MSQAVCQDTAPPPNLQHESGTRCSWRRHIPHLIFSAIGIGGGVAVALGGVEAVFTAIGHTAPTIPSNLRTGLAAAWLMLWLGAEWTISSFRRANAKRRSLIVSALISIGLAAMVGAFALAFAK